MLAGLAFVGCSNENDVVAGGDTDPNNSTSYMAVNLVSSDVMGTRAATGYEDGSDVENHVSSVRFYFFNGAGGAVNVKYQANGSYVNYYDWTPNTSNPDDTPEDPDQSNGTNPGDDIESKLKATIVINTAGGDKIPQRIAAVLNPPTINGTPLLGSESISLSTLKEKVADFAASDLTTIGNFVMFNSVGGKKTDFSTTLIEKANLCKNETDAKNNPVTIYVERSVAKVRVTLGTAVSAAGTAKLALKDKEGKDIKVDGKQVYLKLDGWGLTAETSEGRLIKKVNPKWEGNSWYSDHRSFWAINSMSATNKYKNYNAINTTFAAGNALYTNENAQLTDVDGTTESQAKERTKVIFKGTLCDATGAPFTIVRHLGAYFGDTESDTEAENLKELKKSILNQLAANGKNYYYDITGGRAQIGIGDIKIVIASQGEKEGSKDSKNSCYVYAQLTDAAKAKTWYTSSDATVTTTVPSTDINAALANKDVVDRALVWKSGMTYYYHEIEHAYGETKQAGVVRNHIYDVNVTAIAGLGTPVYDPTQVIYPETPDPNSHYIAAQINILSWRVVTNNVQLGY